MLATSLHIRGFKAFADCQVPLAPFSVVVGANGAGKTTALQALSLFGGLTRQTLPEMLRSTGWEYGDLPHLRGRDQRFGATVEFKGAASVEALHWELSLQTRRRPGIDVERVWTGDDLNDPGDEDLLLDRRGRMMKRRHIRTGRWDEIRQTLTSSWIAAIDLNEDADDFPELARLLAWSSGMRMYLLDISRMRRASRRSPELGESGEFLAGFLRHLRDSRPEALKRVLKRVTVHYPRLQSIRLIEKKAGWTELTVGERWGSRTIQFNARQVSDGLLRLLAMAAMFEIEPAPSLVLVDEIENGLHPHLLRGVIEILQELVDEAGGATQVLATTHSPIALNYIRDASQILVAYREPDTAAAQVRRMVDLPRYEALSPFFDKGDLWYNAGEEVLVANPETGRR